MKYCLLPQLILFFLLYSAVNAQETDHYYDFESLEGLTIFAEPPPNFSAESAEAGVLSALNGSFSQRKQFIENDLLENAGFRKTGNIKFRRTNASEKTLSVLHGIISPFSFGIVPMKPFFEIDYERLPDGEFYSFESVIIKSDLKNISPEVKLIMEIEYMLQVEFCNGILVKSKLNYYTEDNINKFENLILILPEFPERVWQFKERYLDIELPKIKRAFKRLNNPSDNYLRAKENLSGILVKGLD